MSETCESPIETEMLFHLRTQCWVPFEIVEGKSCNELWKMAAEDHELKRLFVAPQCTFKRWRIDFVLARHKTWQISSMLAVECDGHEFHRATQDQIDRDIARDAVLRKRMITPMRFSGGRIMKSGIWCAREALVEIIGEKRDVFSKEARIARREGAHAELADNGGWLD
jgi:very-short-patch-repair endonuclease